MYVCVYIHTYIYTRICICLYVHTYIYIYIYTRICICFYVHKYTRICICLYVHIYIYTRIWYVYVYTYIIYIYICTSRICICLYVHTHIYMYIHMCLVVYLFVYDICHSFNITFRKVFWIEGKQIHRGQDVLGDWAGAAELRQSNAAVSASEKSLTMTRHAETVCFDMLFKKFNFCPDMFHSAFGFTSLLILAEGEECAASNSALAWWNTVPVFSHFSTHANAVEVRRSHEFGWFSEQHVRQCIWPLSVRSQLSGNVWQAAAYLI